MTSSAIEYVARAVEVTIVDEHLTVRLADGRTLLVPVRWFPRLAKATSTQRANVRIIGEGEYLNWPDIDEDLTVASLLRGTPAPGGHRE